MTALRQKMIAAMRQRGFAQRTHNTYLMVVTDLARYFHRSSDTLSTDDLQHFFNHLVQERGLSAASCRVYLILPSNSGHLKNVIRYDEVNHGKIDNINEEKIIYPLLRWLPARSISAC